MTIASNLRGVGHGLRVATNVETLRGSQRNGYLDVVWGMYQATYRRIGMSVSKARDLYKYPVWEVFLGTDGEHLAFVLYKDTPYGLKLGLGGQNGSPAGKSLAKSALGSVFRKPGYYGEVSHAVLKLALRSGAPVICNSYVEAILGKSIHPIDELYYERRLTGVGMVRKLMMGLPKGVPATTIDNPSCPASKTPVSAEWDEEGTDTFHYTCLALSL